MAGQNAENDKFYDNLVNLTELNPNLLEFDVQCTRKVYETFIQQLVRYWSLIINDFLYSVNEPIVLE